MLGEFSNETIYLFFWKLSGILKELELYNHKLVDFSIEDIYFGEAENDGQILILDSTKIIEMCY